MAALPYCWAVLMVTSCVVAHAARPAVRMPAAPSLRPSRRLRARGASGLAVVSLPSISCGPIAPSNTLSDRSAKSAERGAEFARLKLRLLQCGEGAAFVDLVEVDEVVIGALRPTPGRPIFFPRGLALSEKRLVAARGPRPRRRGIANDAVRTHADAPPQRWTDQPTWLSHS